MSHGLEDTNASNGVYNNIETNLRLDVDCMRCIESLITRNLLKRVKHCLGYYGFGGELSRQWEK